MPNKKLWNRDFILLTLSNFLMCCAYYSLISTLPVFISHELKASSATVGIVMASYVVAAVVIRPFCGFSLDKFGRKTIFLISLFIYAITFNGYLVATNVILMITIRFIHGLTWGLTTTSNSTVAGDIIPRDKMGRGFGYFGVSTTLGMALGPMAGALIFQAGGYVTMFVAGCLISLVSMALASSIRYPAYYLPKISLKFKWKNLFETRTILPSLNLMVIMLTYGGLISFVALYGIEIKVTNPSAFFLFYSCGIITSRFAVGRALDQHGPKNVVLICLTLLIIGFPLLALWQSQTGFHFAALILGFGNGVIFPTFQTMTNTMVPASRRGAASSTLFISVDIGMGLGMVLVGTIAQHFSIATAFMVCSVICISGMIFFLSTTLRHYLTYSRKLTETSS